MKHAGDFTPGKTVYVAFNTRTLAGVPATLSGSPAVSVYKRGSDIQDTDGVTLSVDYDSRTGYNVVAIDTSADGAFYAAGNDFGVVITTGTVDSISVVGVEVGFFSLNNRSALRPTTADRTLTVEADGMAHADVKEIEGADATNQIAASVPTPPTANAIADQVWDEATSGHQTAGSTGKALTDGITSIDYDQLLPQLVGTRISLVQQVFVRGQPLRIVQGDSGDVDHDTEIRFHWDNPPDLSGATVNFYGQHRDDATDLFSWDADFETISATREDIVVEWDDDMSEALTSGQYDCRLVVQFADGQQYHLVIGQEGSDRYIFPLDVLPAWEGSP